MAAGGLEVLVLGPVVVGSGGTTLAIDRPLERALLVRLALAKGVVVPDERLGVDLWQEEDPQAISRRLRVLVSRLRMTLGARGSAIVRAAGGYRVDAEVVDLGDARAAADRLHAAVRAGDHGPARAAAADALSRWRGPSLTDLRGVPFALAEAERLDAWRLDLTVHRLSADVALGTASEVVTELSELASENPLHERIWGLLAVSLYRAGRQAEALATLATLRSSLVERLGVDPTADTAELEMRLLRHDPALRSPGPPPPQPSAEPAGAERGLVGRDRELAQLSERLDSALSGRPAVVLVEGEAGIGKTRLLEELDHLAGRRGLPTVWGRAAADDGVPAFWPWRQALRRWKVRTDPGTVAAVVGDAAGELGTVVPELDPLGRAGAPSSGQLTAEDRFALFDAVSTVLADAATASNGLVIVLDDLHWADTASLLLLAHVARHVHDGPLLIAAGVRIGDVRAARERNAMIADLAGQHSVSRITLTGLSPDAVAQQLDLVLGRPCEADVAATIARRTAGNPLFVGEIGRMLSAGTTDAGEIPAAVREAIRQRVGVLPDECRAMLSSAAVLGADIDAGLVAAVTGLDLDEVLAQLDHAASAAVARRTDRHGQHRFSHDIVRDCLHLDVTPGERARVHLRAAEHLEATGDPDDERSLTHHRLEALPLGDAARAVDAARRSAAKAMSQLAFEDAARLLDRAAATTGIGLSVRAELLLDLARAQHLGHDIGAAMRTCATVAGIATDAGDVEMLARAALVLQDVSDPVWLGQADTWAGRALGDLPTSDSTLRAQLLAQQAMAAIWTDEFQRAAHTSEAAMSMADRLGDPAAMFSALRARQLVASAPGGTHERLVLGDRMLGLAPVTGDPATLWGRLWRFDALVQLGRIGEADMELDLLEPVVARMRQPLARWHLIRCRAAIHAARGQFADARAEADEAARVAEEGQHHSAEFASNVVRIEVAGLSGTALPDIALDEVERFHPPPRLLSLLTAEWHTMHGDLDEAARIYTRLPRADTIQLKPFMHLLFHACVGPIAVALGDVDTAEHSYAALAPFAHLHATAGAGAGFTRGSIHLPLGIIAAATGHNDEAIVHLRTAADANARSGLEPLAAIARYRLAEQLRKRGEPEDRTAADAEAAAADATATRLGMGWLHDRLAALPT